MNEEVKQVENEGMTAVEVQPAPVVLEFKVSLNQPKNDEATDSPNNGGLTDG